MFYSRIPHFLYMCRIVLYLLYSVCCVLCWLYLCSSMDEVLHLFAGLLAYLCYRPMKFEFESE